MVNYTLFLDGEIFSDYLYYYEEKDVYTYGKINKIDGGTLQIHHILEKLPKNNYDYSIFYLGQNICSSHSNIRKHSIIKKEGCKNCKIQCCKNKEIWRINSFLGIDELGKCYENDKEKIQTEIKKYIFPPVQEKELEKIINNPTFILINDTGNTDIDESQFKKYLSVNNPEIIFLSSNPLFFNISRNSQKKYFLRAYIDFFQNMNENENYLHKTIYITNIEELRDAGANIKNFLSWEQISQEVLWHIEFDKKFNFLTNFLMIIVRIDFEGAIVIYPKKKPFDAYLFFDPNSIEGDFKSEIPGMMKMSSTFFMTSLAHFFMDKNYTKENIILKDKKDTLEFTIDGDLKEGKLSNLKNLFEFSLSFIRMNYLYGYSIDGINNEIQNIQYCFIEKYNNQIKKQNPGEYEKSCKNSLGVNFKLTTAKIKNLEKECSKLETDWSILCDFRSTGKSMGRIAYKILKYGSMFPSNDEKIPVPFPLYHLGRIRSIDRTEIESYQSIKNTFIEFFSSSTEKPLSITVFGPPGSGKSFGIEEIINTIEKEKASILKFNLSQFSGYNDLIKAFHKIRDYALKGKIPIVFFDEFDSDIDKQQLGWLKFFLSPMQDGEFFDGEMTHPIGKSIFVFAGGIYPTLNEFCNGKDDGNNDIDVYNHDFANAKGLDFLSRLRGYINIIGCDQTKPSDEIYKVRRALLLRSILEEKAPNFFKSDVLGINDDVRRAFIKVSSFKHGVRSMKAIVDMSKIGTKKRYEVALLPSYHQLELHTDAYDFNVLILRDIQFIEKLDKITDRVKVTFNEINKTLNYKEVSIPLFSIPDQEIEKMKRFLKIFIDNSNIEKISKQIALSIPDFLKSINCSYKTRNKNNNNLSKEGLITKDKILVKIGEKNVNKKIERYNRIFDYFGRKTPEYPLKLFEEMISKDSYLGVNWHYFEYVDEDYKPLIKSFSECLYSNQYEKRKVLEERLLNVIFFIEFFYPKIPAILDDDFVIYPL